MSVFRSMRRRGDYRIVAVAIALLVVAIMVALWARSTPVPYRSGAHTLRRTENTEPTDEQLELRKLRRARMSGISSAGGRDRLG